MSRRVLLKTYREAQTVTPGLPVDAVVQHVQGSLGNLRAAVPSHVFTSDQFGQKHREVRGIRSDQADLFTQIRFLCPYKHDPNTFLESRKTWYGEAAHAPNDLVAVSAVHHIGLIPSQPGMTDSADEASAPNAAAVDESLSYNDAAAAAGDVRDCDSDVEPDLSVNAVVLGSPMTRDVWSVQLNEPFNPIQPLTRVVEVTEALVTGTGQRTVTEDTPAGISLPTTTRLEPVRLVSTEYPVAMGFLPQTVTLRGRNYAAGNVLGAGTGRPLRCAVIAPYAPPGAILSARVLGAVGLLPQRYDAEVVTSTLNSVSSTPAVPSEDDAAFSAVYRAHPTDPPMGEVEWVVICVADSAGARGLRRMGRLSDVDDSTLSTLVDFLRWEGVMTAGAATPSPPRDVAVIAERFTEPASSTVAAVQARMNVQQQARSIKDADEVPTFTPAMANNRKAFLGRSATMSLINDAYVDWSKFMKGEHTVPGIWSGREAV